jgi:hypothetical protein
MDGAGPNRSLGYGRRTTLLGLISGHFHTLAEGRTNVDEGLSWRVPVNSGVGIVTPVEAIRETLGLDQVVEERKAREANP